MEVGERGVDAPLVGGRRAQRWLGALALLGVAAGTFAGWRLATTQEEEEVERAAQATLVEARAALVTLVEQTVGGLRGAGVLVDDRGELDVEGFRVFGGELLGAGVDGVALGVHVLASERGEFEAENGPIVQRRPGGSARPSPAADEHFPILAVVSPVEDYQRVVGWDYAADPIRASAVERARDAGQAVVSAPTVLQPDGRRGFVVVHPVYRRGAAVDSVAGRQAAFVGFLTVAYDADEALGALVGTVAAGTELTVSDAGEPLLRHGDPSGPFALVADVDVPGRTWSLLIEPADETSSVLATFILVGGVTAVAGLVLLFGVTARYQRRLRQAHAARVLSQRRSEVLENLASQLSRSLSGVEVGESLLDELPAFTGTTAGAVLVLDDDGTRLQLLAAHGYPDDAAARFRDVLLDEPSALARAVREAEPAWLASPLAWREDEVTSRFAAVGQAAAVVPLVADPDVVGVLVLVHPRVRGFYEDERTLLTTVAALAARAINRARRYDVEHHAAEVLQRALLPSVIPESDDLAVAVRYLPATDGLAVGGDWYDAFALDDGRMALVVGDVVGRGVRAAAAMGRLRSALRAMAQVVPEPGALLRAFAVQVTTIPDALCATMIYALVDPAAGVVTYVRAGHPPPIVARRGGGAVLLEGGLVPPLGVTGAEPPSAATFAIAPGDTLLLYTDGVVERRGEAVTVGVERLRTVVAGACDDGPEACCDRIVEAMLGAGGHDDDAAVVAVQIVADRERLEPKTPVAPFA